MNFSKQKQESLTKIDNSKKGSIDVDIKELVDLINKNPDYYTTSSCSGRIVVLSKKSEKKDNQKLKKNIKKIKRLYSLFHYQFYQ